MIIFNYILKYIEFYILMRTRENYGKHYVANGSLWLRLLPWKFVGGRASPQWKMPYRRWFCAAP